MMNAVVICRLMDIQVANKLSPLCMLPDIERIAIVRLFPGPDLPKTTYVCPPTWLKVKALRYVLLPLLMLWAILKYRPRFLWGVFLFPHGMLASLLGYLTRTPVIVSIIGSDLHTRFYAQTRLWKRLILYMLNHASAVTVTGSHSHDEAVAIGLRKERLHILPNPVDENRFSPSKSGSPVFDLIFVAKLIPGKQPQRFIELVAEVKKNIPTVTAVLVGDGAERPQLEQMVHTMTLETHVTFMGHIDNVATYLNQSRLFVLPTKREGLPVAAIEAMACGLPCVITNVNDIGDLVRDGENGILLDDFSDLEAVAKSIAEILQDPRKYSRISSRALESVSGYTMKATSEVWTSLLSMVISQS